MAARRWAKTTADERTAIGRRLNEIRWESRRTPLHGEIIERIERGLSNPEIAAELKVPKSLVVRLRYRKRLRINALATRAIARGELVRPSACSECQKTARVQAHHDDYSQPFNVRWLCARCHLDFHKAAKRAGR